MCDVLQLPKSTYYYEAKIRDNQDDELAELIVEIFKKSRNIYGQRKIKKCLKGKAGLFPAVVSAVL